uniref:Uncharacterized protein n=1 Tax=Rhizophora mucronata TaxID=61149 RepID=A0A2P2NBB8_RHIMU
MHHFKSSLFVFATNLWLASVNYSHYLIPLLPLYNILNFQLCIPVFFASHFLLITIITRYISSMRLLPHCVFGV